MRRAAIRRFLNSELQPDQLFQRCKAYAWRGQGSESLELYPNLRTAPVSYHLAVLNAFTNGDICDANSAEQWLNLMAGSSSASSSSKGVSKNAGTPPTSDCFVLVAKAFVQKEQFQNANDVLERMRQSELELNVEQYELLIKVFSSHGRVKDVEKFCDRMQEDRMLPTIVCYNHLIRAHANNSGDGVSALRVLDELPSRLKPTVGSFNGVLQAASKKGDKKLADECMTRMEMLRIAPDKSSFSSVITACARDSNVQAAMNYLDDMKKVKLKVDLECFTGVLAGYAKQGNTTAAADLLQKMTENKIEPDRAAFNCVLDAFGKANDVQGASRVLESMRVANLKPNVISYTGVISGFCRKRDFVGALRTIKKMEDDGIQPDAVILNMLISSYGRAGDATQARRMFNRILALQREQENDSSFRGKKVRPTLITYNSMIDAYARVGDSVSAEEIFEFMTENSKITPNVVTFACLANSYAQRKDLFGALQIVQRSQQARVAPDLKFLNGVLGAFEANMAKQALGFVESMGQKYGVNPDFLSYVQVVNLFVKLNDSGKVQQLLSRMEELGLTRDDGWRASVLRAVNLPQGFSSGFNSSINSARAGTEFRPTRNSSTTVSGFPSATLPTNAGTGSNFTNQSPSSCSNSDSNRTSSLQRGSIHVSPTTGIHVSSSSQSVPSGASANIAMENISIIDDASSIPRSVIRKRKKHEEANTRRKDPGFGEHIIANILSHSASSKSTANPKLSLSGDGDATSMSTHSDAGNSAHTDANALSRNDAGASKSFIQQSRRPPRKNHAVNLLDPTLPSVDGVADLDFSMDSSRALNQNR